MKTNQQKSCEQLINELDLLIEADFQRAKAELEEFKTKPSVFNLFEIGETELIDIFADENYSRTTEHE